MAGNAFIAEVLGKDLVFTERFKCNQETVERQAKV